MIPKFSVKKPLTVFVITLAVVILGIVAYTKMTPDLMPNMDFPYVIVVTTDPGASPESIEQEITRPIEESMATLDHIKSITSTSQNSVSMVVLEFENGTDLNTLSIDMQQKLTALQGDWDEMVSAPYMLKINPSMLPVMVAAISYEGKDVEELSDFVSDELQQKLTGISGVASVDISGTLERQMHVILDEEKLDKVSAEMLAEAEKLLDEAEKTLKDAREQVVDAQEMLDDVKVGIVDSTIGGVYDTADSIEAALKELQDLGVDDLPSAEDILSSAQTEAERNVLISEANTLEQSIAASELLAKEYSTALSKNRIELSNAKEALVIAEDPQEIALLQEQIALLESRVTTLEDSLATLESDLAADRASLEELDQRLKDTYQYDRKKENANAEKETKDALAAVQEVLETISSKTAMTDLLVGAMDGIQMMSEAEFRLNDALTQIDQALALIETERKELKSTLDVGGMLTVSVIEQLLTAQNFSMPAGYIDDSEGVSYMVSVGDSLASREEVEALVLFDPGLGDMDPIRLEDVATVIYTDNSDEIYAKLNGVNGIIATFTKQSTYATAEVSDSITARLDELSEEYEGLSFKPLMDQGDYIYLIVETILSSLLWGALFSVVILFLFLRDWRPTLITLISIPTSVIFAIVLMYFSGVSINMISLSGLAVSVGMLVDNSVVVIENVYRLRARGATVTQAAVSGAQQVAGAITSSTLTTVCVFAPIVFVEGFTRELFADLALTMTYALLASLLVALTVVPAMGNGMLRKLPEQKPGLLDKLTPAYRKAIAWSLEHKALVLLASLVLLVASAAAILGRGFVFMPEMDMNNVNVTVTTEEAVTREGLEDLLDEISARIMTIEEVDAVGATIDSDSSTSLLGGGGATVYVTMPGNVSGNKVGKQIEELCADMDCTVTAANVMDGMMSMMTGSGISVQVLGDDMEHLQSAAKTIAAACEEIEGVATVSDGLEEAAPALHVSVDRTKAMQHGMTVAQVYLEVAAALSTSSSAQDIELDDKSFSLTIEAAEGTVLTRETLLELRIDPDSSISAAMSGSSTGDSALSGMSSMSSMDLSSMDMGALASLMGGETADTEAKQEETETAEDDTSFLLGDVATVEETVSLNTISHDQQRRTVTVTVTLAEGYNVTLVSAELEKAIGSLTLPEGVEIAFAGENETIMEAISQLGLMLVLGLLLVYFIMVAQFQSLREPFIVMFTIPLAFTGGFLALLIAGMEISVISLIGFVMLMGIIVNNGIVLVDYINQQRVAGVERREAVVDAGITRLRPILMTSLTTILGLIVTATAQNAGTSLMRPVALVCIGGLLYATLMTLFVVPCMYEIISKKNIRVIDESELEILED